MFKLLIECTKDIDKLSIDFSDGSSVIKEKPPNEQVKNKEDLLLDDYDYTQTQTKQKIDKPIIEEHERPVKVASELQNLDI